MIITTYISIYISQLRSRSKLVKLEEQLGLSNHNLQKLEAEKNHFLSENQNLIGRLATSEADRNNLITKLNDQKVEITRLHEDAKREFKLLANEIMKSNSQDFKQSSGELLTGILNPLKEKIDHFQKDVQHSRETQIKENSQLREQITNLLETSNNMAQEAANLTNALRKESKTRGDWGEMILESILSKSGLVEGEQYTLQKGFENEDGRKLKPDAIIYLPDEKNIIIDSKVQLIAYDQYINAPENEKEAHLLQHVAAIKNHIKELSDKNYRNLYNINSPDFVLMFLPIEPAFNLALEKDISIYNNALERGIVLVTPSTLIATLKIVYTLWRQDKQNKNAILIAETGGNLYDKLVGFMDNMKSIGTQLDKSKSVYLDAYKQLYTGKGNAMSQAEKMKELGAKSKKSIPNSEFIEKEEG